jgi:hypothetical protein
VVVRKGKGQAATPVQVDEGSKLVGAKVNTARKRGAPNQ